MTAHIAPGTAAPYAARLIVDYPERLDRLTTLLRLVWILPIVVLLSIIDAAGVGAWTGGALLGGLWLSRSSSPGCPPSTDRPNLHSKSRSKR